MASTRYKQRRVIGTSTSSTPANFEAYITSVFAGSIAVRYQHNDNAANTIVVDTSDMGLQGGNGTTVGNTNTRSVAGINALDASDKGLTYDGVSQYTLIAQQFYNAATTKGALIMVMKFASSNAGSVKNWLFAMKPAGATGNILGYCDTTGFYNLRISAVGDNTTFRQWQYQSNVYDNAYHLFCWVQRADGTGVHLFIDGTEVSVITVTSGAGTIPSQNAWFGLHDGQAYDHNIMRLGRPGSQFVTGTVDHFSVINNVTVTDAHVADLQAYIAA